MPHTRQLHVHVLVGSLSWGGAESLIADFAVGARSAGLRVSVGYLHPEARTAGRLTREGIEPVLVPIGSLLGRADRRAVLEHVAGVAPDLLHTHLGYPDFLGGLAARRLGIPAVSTLHTMATGGSIRERTRSRLMELARRRCASKVIAVSEAQRGHYVANSWDRSDHVVTVRNGIVDRARPGIGATIRAELGIDAGDPVAAMVSVLRPGKGHEVAAAAVNRLRARFPRLRLLVLGDGPDYDRVSGLMRPLGGNAVMMGYREDAVEVLDAVDVLVHPSSIDAFPTSPIEAMSAGVPVVATNVGGIPEAVRDNEAGLLIPAPPDPAHLADAVAAVLGDDALRHRLSERARARFEAEFTVGRWMERLHDVYDAVLVGPTAIKPW